VEETGPRNEQEVPGVLKVEVISLPCATASWRSQTRALCYDQTFVF
jgi:hypothetical protein